MRIFVLFALSLTGTALITDDASAFGRRNRGGGNCCGGAPAYTSSCCGGGGGYGYGGSYAPSGFYGASYGGGYGMASSSCCGGSQMAYGGYPGGLSSGSSSWLPGGMMGTTVNGQESVIRATDGSVYTLGSDGHYYAAGSNMSTLGGFTTQPYYGQPYYGNGYRSFYGSGIYPAGYGAYPGYSGIYPAGGTSPLTMPGVNLPGGITIVPTPMPNK